MITKKTIQLLALLLGLTGGINAQYQFKKEKRLDCTEVKNQNRTGTCWSYATSSLLESELIRLGHEPQDLSEMFIVRNIYKDKAMNYVLRQGKANFSQGSLSHDLLRTFGKVGIVPQQAYMGLAPGEKKYNHSELEGGLKGYVQSIAKAKHPSPHWMKGLEAIMDVYMGPAPKEFNVNGKQYTPKSYAKSLGINADDYVSLTSFTHHPFNEEFILEIPDNYSNGAFYNIPMDDLYEVAKYAVANGFTVAWDGDVSEDGFSARQGLAVLPVNTEDKAKAALKSPQEEIKPTQELRQQWFMDYHTTDDHLMHLVGTAKDQNGTNYFIIKNSWGEISEHKGYLYMSEAYFKMKTVALLLHKDGIPKGIIK